MALAVEHYSKVLGKGGLNLSREEMTSEVFRIQHNFPANLNTLLIHMQ